MIQKIAVTPILILMVIIFISGTLGGTVNYLMNNFSKKWSRYEFLKSLLFGVFFSAIILFFLEATTNNLIHNTEQTTLNYIVFGCLCFLSSIFLSIILTQIVAKFPKFGKWGRPE